jgi:capsid protein
MSLSHTPLKTVRLSAYYDAAATTSDADFGSFLSVCPEDYWFNQSTRLIALSRCRRELRNNPYLVGLHMKYPEAIGISNMRARTPDKKYNATKDYRWFKWSKAVTPARDTRQEVEEMIILELLAAGEVFIVTLANGKIQLIPSEFCGSPMMPANNAELRSGEVNGIVYGDEGQPLAYRFGKALPGGGISYEQGTLVAATHVRHVFHKSRVMMGRGLPWLLSSLRPARDLYEITRAKTKQIKDANSISGFIESERKVADILPGLGGGGAMPEPESEEDSADKETSDPVVVELKPGTFITLTPGEKINMLKSEYDATDYKELIMIMLHAISSPVGLPVELWFSGLGDVNYSGFKGLGVQWNSRRRHVLSFLESKFLDPLQEWWSQWETLVGNLPQGPEHDSVEWAWRQTAVLDEEKQARANKLRLDSGECTLADIWEERGQYAEEVFEKRRELWRKLQEASGIQTPVDSTAPGAAVPVEFLYRGRLPGEQIQGAAKADAPIAPEEPQTPTTEINETK